MLYTGIQMLNGTFEDDIHFMGTAISGTNTVDYT